MLNKWPGLRESNCKSNIWIGETGGGSSKTSIEKYGTFTSESSNGPPLGAPENSAERSGCHSGSPQWKLKEEIIHRCLSLNVVEIFSLLIQLEISRFSSRGDSGFPVTRSTEQKIREKKWTRAIS